MLDRSYVHLILSFETFSNVTYISTHIQICASLKVKKKVEQSLYRARQVLGVPGG